FRIQRTPFKRRGDPSGCGRWRIGPRLGFFVEESPLGARQGIRAASSDGKCRREKERAGTIPDSPEKTFSRCQKSLAPLLLRRFASRLLGLFFRFRFGFFLGRGLLFRRRFLRRRAGRRNRSEEHTSE